MTSDELLKQIADGWDYSPAENGADDADDEVEGDEAEVVELTNAKNKKATGKAA